MTSIFRISLIVLLLGSLLSLPHQDAQAVPAATTITFESGTDGAAIGSDISGLTFGAGWVYGDWRSARYNGKHPDGDYTSSGSVFAWLGQTQTDGRIDFIEGNASYVQVKISTGVAVTLKGYDGHNNLVDTEEAVPNVNSGSLTTLRVEAANGVTLHHVTLVGSANAWVIDDLETDAGNLPSPRLPVIFLPGVGGSRLVNNSGELWPNTLTMAISADDYHLNPLHLQADGTSPEFPNDPAYSTVHASDILRTEWTTDVYQGTVNFFLSKGYIEGQTFFACPYDWRKDLRQIAYNYNPNYPLNITLDICINAALAANPDVRKVNIVAHSMGWLVARTYLIDPARAAKVKNLVTLGTPYFGATKIAQMALAPEGCFLTSIPLANCNPNPAVTYSLLRNFPSGYQLSPGEGFFMVYPDGYLKRWGAYLNYTGTMDQFRTRNAALMDDAIAFRQAINVGYTNGANNGVNVAMFVGHGLPTIVRLDEKAYGWNSYNQVMDDGDGTVPLRSASMQNLDLNPAVNLVGAANLIFVNGIEHGALAREGAVLEGAYAFLMNNQTTAKDIAAGSNILSTEAEGMSGRVIQVDGPVVVRIYDENGNLTGPDANVVMLKHDIPGLFYQFNDTSTVVIKLPQSGNYRIELQGMRTGSASLRAWNYEDGRITRSIQYLTLPASTSSHGKLEVTDDFIAAPPALQQTTGQAAPVEIQPEIIEPEAQ